jgi:hypothetical protein
MVRSWSFRWSRVIASTLTVALLVAAGVGIRAQQDTGLFVAASQPDLQEPAAVRAQLRARHVGVSFGRLPATTSVDSPADVLLNLFPDAEFSTLIDRIETNGLNSTTYFGHVKGFANTPDGNDSNQVTLVVLDGVMEGSVVTPAGAFQINFDGSAHVVRQVDPSAYPEDQIVQAPETPAVAAYGPVVMSDDGSRTDLMVLYTAAARAQQGGTAAMQARITLGVAETNQAYANSGIGTRLRLVHMRETSYVELGANTDLNNLSNGSGVLNVVPGLRNQYGADLVKLVTTNAGCGIAWLAGPAGSMAGQASYGFSVTENSCISPNYTFGHELGHNQGSNHAPGDPVGTGAYDYSFGFRRCSPNSPLFRSVMAYACPSGTNPARSLNFSNPNVNVGGSPTGTASQYNAASIHNTRTLVANWRTQQPLIRVTSLWPPADQADRRAGQTTTLWAYVVNDGPYALTANDRVWYWTDGPGASAGEGWVGSALLTGLGPGAGAWYAFNWTIPTTATPGAWVYWAITYNHAVPEYTSNWTGPQAFTVLSVAANVSQTWPVANIQAGQGASNLWAYVNNTGTGAFPAETYVYYWVRGPGGLDGYVGYTSVAGLAPGAGGWYLNQWNVPINRTAGAHTYWAIVWNYSASGGGWRAISGWSSSQTWQVTAAPTYGGNVTQTWPVSTPAGGTVSRGNPARLWSLGYNSGTATHDANTHLWFYVTGPTSPGYVGSVVTNGQTSGSTVWRLYDWTIPGAYPLGTYTYYGIFWRWNGSSWVQLGPFSAGRAFGVASDQAPDGAQDLIAAPPPAIAPVPPPPPPKG